MTLTRRSLGLLLLAPVAASCLWGATDAAAAGRVSQSAPVRADVTPTVRVLSGGPMINSGTSASGIEDFSSVAVGDLQGPDTPDAVVGFKDGTLHAWNLQTGHQFLDVDLHAGAIQASPTLVTLDGHLDILGATIGGLVFVMRANGTFLFRMTLPSFYGLNGVFGTPTVSYLDDNSTPWIVFSSYNQNLYAVNLQGHEHPGFPYFLQDTSWSSPAVATIPGQKYPTIFVGYDCTGNSPQACYENYRAGGGYITALNHDGKVEPGWPYFVRGETVWSSPAVGDLNGKKGQLDVVVGTGLYDTAPNDNEVIALTSSGKLLPHWPVHVDGRVFASPAIGRLNGKPYDYIAVTASSGFAYLISANGHIDWMRCPFTGASGGSCLEGHSSAIMADIAGLGSPQVIAASDVEWRAFTSSGASVTDAYVTGTIGLASTPTAADVDGHAVLLYSSVVKGATYGDTEVVEYTYPKPLGPSPWPTFKQNSARTGVQPG